MEIYDVIVVGGGHAGTEAALASARMGCKTILITMRLDRLGFMSCNPAIGGIGKGQLVKEIDALGGEMAKAADSSGIQFRQLNSSKGPAVHSSRAQEDRKKYQLYIRNILENQEGLFLKEVQATKLLVKDRIAVGIKTHRGEEIFAKTVIVTPGTFLNGVIHIGLKHFPGGRLGDDSAIELSRSLGDLGFHLLRFKTGTCPRLDGRTIDFSKLQAQKGDEDPTPFSFSMTRLINKQVPCYITYTNKKTHQIIRSNLGRSPLFTGIIKATGVRYCPSIEDKIVKFADKQRHQIFLEPEGLDTFEFYPNGLATSLPIDVQEKMLHSIEGLEKARVTHWGYGIEYDLVDPTQLYPTLETKLIKNLFLAGQINGTTGYEEAASQGLIAGINAVLRVKGKKPFTLGRSTSYIGVLIDDLVTKGTNEPYRMFTSRVEYRLLIREDNADLRLRKMGYELGLVSREDYKKTEQKQNEINTGLEYLRKRFLRPNKRVNEMLAKIGIAPLTKSLSMEEILRRPEIRLKQLKNIEGINFGLSDNVISQIEVEVKYSGYIKRQLSEVARFRNLENIKIPQGLDYTRIHSLSKEIVEKLTEFSPLSLGQASRISGITPAAISILMVYFKKIKSQISNINNGRKAKEIL